MYNQYDIGTDLLSSGTEAFNESIKNNYNLFYRGIVVDVNDPEKLGRAKIRIPSLHGVNSRLNNFVPDASLPWATPAVWSSAGNDMGTFDPPTAGNRVFVTFEGGKAEYPIYFGGIPTKIGNTKYYKPQVGIIAGITQEVNDDDYNKDIKTGTERIPFKSFKGATIIIDDFDGNEYIKIIDQAGQTFTMGNSGDALPRRNGELGTSSESFIEMTNNRGEVIRIEEGKVIIDGKRTEILSKAVYIPNYEGGGGGGGTVDAYTKEETDALLSNKSRIFFKQPTVPYQVDDLWYNDTTVYRCVNTKKNGSFNINDWVIDTSFMTPEQVNRTVEEKGAQILETVSSIYVTPSYVDEKLNYEMLIYSSQGDIFKNGVIDTMLTAYIRQGNKDVSNKFNDNQYVWSRASADPDGDIAWNRAHISGSRSIRVTTQDVQSKATFTCNLLDEINVVNYVKDGLIEIFDGYDAPTSTGEWMSMIRSNQAIIPNSGVVYDEEKHAYKFDGNSSYGMQLYKPIIIKPGFTYEFVVDLPSYVVIQNILSSNEEVNDNINNRIACAVAGHLQVRKAGYTINAGNVLLNRKTYLSIRYADEDTLEIYYNGDFVDRFIQSGWTSDTADLTHIGRWCNGYIHSIRVYNRLLTPSEISTNYHEDLERFGSN